VLTMDELTCEIIQAPEIITRGFILSRETEGLLEEAKQRISRLAHAGMHKETLQNRIKDIVSQFLYERTKRRPMVLPLIIEV